MPDYWSLLFHFACYSVAAALLGWVLAVSATFRSGVRYLLLSTLLCVLIRGCFSRAALPTERSHSRLRWPLCRRPPCMRQQMVPPFPCCDSYAERDTAIPLEFFLVGSGCFHLGLSFLLLMLPGSFTFGEAALLALVKACLCSPGLII
jgi:hypothetical protein